MKTTLHYIIAILLLSLNATHAFAEGEEEPFKITYKDNNVTYSYNDEKTLLTISGDGKIKIEGDGKTVNCGIVIKGGVLTIKDLNINTNNTPLVFEGVNSAEHEFTFCLEGTNILESTNGSGINLNGNSVIFRGSGSLKVIGGDAASGIQGEIKINENACVVAIGGEGTSGGISPAPNEFTLTSGLLISGTKQTGGSINQDYSELKGDLTLAADLEIPEGATVNIAEGQTFTIADGVTLTNYGSLTNEGSLTNNGAIINNGTLTQTGTFINNGTLTENDIVTSNKSLNIEGEEGFDVSTEGDKTTFKYDKQNNLLTISGSSSVLLKGRNKDKAVNCGIVIKRVGLTIKDLNINTNNTPLVFEKVDYGNWEYKLYLEGTNILESTNGSGINLNENSVTFEGSGSLKVIGGNAASGIQGDIKIYDNACVVAIGGEGASGISHAPNELAFTSGLLISGTKQTGGSINQNYSELKGDLTLAADLEIPEWATVTIPQDQSITIAEGKTLTNNGAIINNGTLTQTGTFINNGTLTEKGIVTSNKSLNIEGEEGFDVSTNGNGATFSYDGANNLLTISGNNSVLLKGRNKDKAVNCGIVIKRGGLTIKDLNINTNNTPLVFERDVVRPQEYKLYLEGTNILESTNGSGININGDRVHFEGSGSLTVIGGNGASGIQGEIKIYENACVVAIGGEGASGGINPASNNYTHISGLLISGTKQGDGSIKQDYSELKGDLTLAADLEIPEGATVNIAEGQTFTIANGVTLTNYGTITNNGTFHNNGTLLNNGTLTGNKPKHHITFKANDSASTADDERYITEGEPLPTDIFTRSGYTFQGWFTDPDSGTKVEKVTQPQTLYAQWKADEPAVEPEPPYVPPTPIYYSVYLPQVEGATTDPGPGEYEVESWSTFRFYLTIDSAYSDSQPVVTTDRGETLVPRSSDGAYLVKYVRTDVEVFIDGLIQNPPPVANEAISTDALAPQIWAEGSMLCIRMPEALPSSPIRIFTADGRLYDSFASTPGLSRRQLPTGIYIVRMGDTACKVIIK